MTDNGTTGRFDASAALLGNTQRAPATIQTQARFEWIVEAVSEMARTKTGERLPDRDNLRWAKCLQAASSKNVRSMSFTGGRCIRRSPTPARNTPRLLAAHSCCFRAVTRANHQHNRGYDLNGARTKTDVLHRDPDQLLSFHDFDCAFRGSKSSRSNFSCAVEGFEESNWSKRDGILHRMELESALAHRHRAGR